MSVYLYEESLVKALREVTGDERIHIVSPDKSIEFFAQFDKDKTKYPAIVLSRGPLSLLEYQNQPVKLKGQTANIDKENYVVKAQLLNFRMSWNVDIYAVDRYTCDEILRELLFYFTMHPRFEVKVPYGLDIVQNFDVFIEDDITDNTDLVDFNNTGEFFRETFTIYTENGHFYYSRRQYQVFGKPDVDIIKSNKGDE